MIEILHEECALCQARSAESMTQEESAQVLLVAIVGYWRWEGADIESWVKTLCFYHRRQVEAHLQRFQIEVEGA